MKKRPDNKTFFHTAAVHHPKLRFLVALRHLVPVPSRQYSVSRNSRK